MPLRLTNTSQLCSTRGTNFILTGPPKVGKTVSLRTLPGQVLIADVEDGQLSNRDCDIPAVQITCWDDAQELLLRLKEDVEFQKFDCIAVDSISELAEIKLAEELKRNTNKLAAYGVLSADMTEWLKEMKRLPQHIVFICKYQRNKEGLWQPLFPGNNLAENLFFWMDEILVMRMVPDEKGQPQRVLQCQSCDEHQAGDRSGALDFFEPPNLGHIITKIMSGGLQQ